MKRELSYYFIVIGLIAGSVVSCEKAPSGAVMDCPVGVRVATAGGIELPTRSGIFSPAAVVPLGEGLFLEEYVSDYPADAVPATRGAIITDDANNSINTDGRSFHMEAWLGASDMSEATEASEADIANHHFLSTVPTRSEGVWNMAENYWRNGIATTFWSYYLPASGPAPVFKWPGSSSFSTSEFGNGCPTDAQLKELSFTYSLPAPGGSGDDATLLQDFLIAYNRATRTRESSDGGIDVKFYHPLAAVKFTVTDDSLNGSPEVGNDEYVNITEVKLVGVKTSATFTAVGSGSDALSISTSAQSGSGTYVQSSGVSRAAIAGTGTSAGMFTSPTSEYVFFMIPQTLTDAKLRITFTKKAINLNSDGTFNSYGDLKTVTQEVPFSRVGTSWEAGKYYTYKIRTSVYAGGETIGLPDDPTKIEHSSGIDVDEDGNISIIASGSAAMEEYVAPLPVVGVKILKLTLTHQYKNNNGKSTRSVWLEDASGETPSRRKTTDSDLVAAARSLTDFFASDYDGILHANDKADYGATNPKTDVFYYYLGGEFSNIIIHFDYTGSTGTGSINWKVEAPLFSITEIVE